MKTTIGSMVGILLATTSLVWAAPFSDAAHGKYQLVISPNGRLHVIDTTTGECWSKIPGHSKWSSEGSPVISEEPAEEPRKPVSLNLPTEPLEITVRQRSHKPIPGSDNRIRIRVSDVTAGQTIVAVVTSEPEQTEEEFLLREMSAKTGDIFQFTVAGRVYFLRVRDIQNILVGDEDFAVFEVSAADLPPEAAKSEDPPH